MKKISDGLTLVELLFCFSIVALILAFATPALQKFFLREEYKASQMQLYKLLNFARSAAVHTGQAMIVCPYQANNTCGKSWEKGQLVFAEKSDPANRKIIFVNNVKQRGKLKWRSSLHKNYLIFYPDGTTHDEAGTFEFKRHYKTLWSIVVNQTGRIRLG